MAKKIIAVLLCGIIAATVLTACTDTNSQPKQKQTSQPTRHITDDDSFKLCYTQSDSLDPFKANTQNNQILASLIFQSLFVLDENYSAQLLLATGYEYTDKKTLKVTINNSTTFSDGSSLTADNVVSSYKAAANSPAYGTGLTGISSASAQSGNTIIFKLSYANPYAHNLLTFPISSQKKDGDGYPIGSGRYEYKMTSTGLTIKAKETDEFKPHLTTIQLMNIAAADSIDNAVNIGNISYAYRDMSKNTNKRMSTAKKAVSINNLVFLGANNKTGITSSKDIRRAVSLALDRQTITKSAYSGYAVSAQSLFHPAFELASDTEIFSDWADISAAKQSIEQSGYEESKLTLTLLVNKNQNLTTAASLIKAQLENVGFKVKIQEEKYDTYKSKIEKSDFDLYLGETKLPSDMCLNAFFSETGNLRFGLNLEENDTAKAYEKYLSGEEELGIFVKSFSENTPYIPVLYKKGMICYSKALRGDMQGHCGNFFSNIDDWYFE